MVKTTKEYKISEQNNSTNSQKSYWWVIALLITVVSLLFFYNATRVGFKNTLIEQHAFRQTQTGLTVIDFLNNGFRIDYETPMYGYPWKLPMEFPTYQFFVYKYVKLKGKDIDLAGRAVSLFFMYMSLIPIFFILKRITGSFTHSFWFYPFIFLHPLIIYWSRSFLIESTCVFFNLTYLWIGLEILYKPKIYKYIIIIIIGVIAPISKSTTGLIHILCLGIFYLYHYIEYFDKPNIVKYTLSYVLKAIPIFLLPLFSTIIWTKYTDNIKNENFTSSFWSSTDPKMKEWNFGTITQKLDINVWKQIDGFEFHLIIIVLLILITAITLRLRYWKQILAFVLAGLTGPIVFTNLYYVHDYYSFANSVLYAIAIGFFIISLIESQTTYTKVIGVFIFCGLSYYLYSSYQGSFYKELQKRNNPYFKYIGENLMSKINKEDGFVFFGMIGDPFVPYYAQRKGVCMSPYYVEEMKKDTLKFLKQIEPSNIKALVLCDVNNQDIKLVQKMIDYFQLNPQPANNDVQQMGYYIFLKKNNNE